MAANHGNTPAAWTAVSVAMVGFVLGSVALMLRPVNVPLLWAGIAIAVVSLPLFLVLDKMGFNAADH
jgi:hydrogenase/urease accessory protein HupE